MGLAHQSLWIASAGAYAMQRRIEVAANNLANASTPGYKRDIVVLKEIDGPKAPIIPLKPVLWDKLHLDQISQSYVLFDLTWTDFSPGSLQETGRPLDLALNGDAFFGIMTPDGLKFTRTLSLHISPEGFLIDSNGNKLVGTDGKPIQLPIEKAIEDIVITEKGDLYVGVRHGEERHSEFIARVGVFRIPHSALRKIGERLFEIKENEVEPKPAEKYQVLQGFLETSNVNPIREMIELIEVQRVYDANVRVATVSDNLLASSAREIGRV